MKFSELIEQSQNEINENKINAGKFFGLSQEQMNWQPAPGKWSIAQCMEHVNIVSRHYLKYMNFNTAIKTMEDMEYKAGFPGGLLTRIFSKTPSKLRLKTTKSFSPQNNLNGMEILKEFISNQEKMLHLADQTVGYDLNRNKVPSPAGSFIKFRFGDVLNLDTKHTARHLFQAGNVMKAAGFPAQ